MGTLRLQLVWIRRRSLVLLEQASGLTTAEAVALAVEEQMDTEERDYGFRTYLLDRGLLPHWKVPPVPVAIRRT